MKIIVLTNECPPHTGGGSGVHVKHLPRELARLEEERHEILILSLGKEREHFDKAQAMASVFE